MPTVVGVRLRFSKTLWFDPAGATPEEGAVVVVDTERGTELGTVVQAPHDVEASALPAALKPMVRIADENDLKIAEEHSVKERDALAVFRSLVESHRLDMKPVDVEYVFSGDKIVFYFSAEERVDFRELVKDLAAQYHARIDMRQVGVRDEARAVGGIGHCGQMLCCVRFGGDFQPVSIRMAKEQDLPLNPLKISGLCGRLMCCLRYEYEAYKDFKGRAPKRGAIVTTPAGDAKVAELNTLRETVRMRLEDGTSVVVPLGEMGCAKGTGCPCSVSRETLEELTQGAVGAAPAPAPVVPVAPAASQQEQAKDGGRKRRRRKPSGGSSDQPAQPEARQSARRTQRDTPKPAAAKQAEPAQGGAKQGETKPAEAGGEKTGRSSRRRRRRRPGGGGGSGGAAAE